MATLAGDTMLNFLIAKEWLETSDVPYLKVTQYIVEKNYENMVLCLNTDEGLMHI